MHADLRIQTITPASLASLTDCELDALGTLLCATVASGAAVSFMLPFTHADARSWWRRTLDTLQPRSAILIARTHASDADHPKSHRSPVAPASQDAGCTLSTAVICGSVQVHAAWAPNQPHRAEIAKLMVHPDAQRRGVGRQLLHAAERHAWDNGFTLLTLDTKRGTPAQRLYETTGWMRVGVIPDFALDPDGLALHDTVIYRKAGPPPAGS